MNFSLKKFTKEELGKLLIPEKIFSLRFRKELESLYKKLYFDNIHTELFFIFFLVSSLLTLVIIFLLLGFLTSLLGFSLSTLGFNSILKLSASWFIINIISYYGVLFFYYSYHASKFKQHEDEIERDLPDFIDNLVSNLKGGISLEKSLLRSVRTDQKALFKEVTLINERILMGENTTEAIIAFKDRFDSPIINRTFFLIIEGLQGGGDLSKPLMRISKNLKKIYALNEELKSGAGGFSMVIRAITLVIAPLLFGLALTLLNFIASLFAILSESGTDILAAAAVPCEFHNYLIIFSLSMISMITLFSSLITAQLKNEKVYESIKYIPMYILISLGLYIVFGSTLDGFFGNIISASEETPECTRIIFDTWFSQE